MWDLIRALWMEYLKSGNLLHFPKVGSLNDIDNVSFEEYINIVTNLEKEFKTLYENMEKL